MPTDINIPQNQLLHMPLERLSLQCRWISGTEANAGELNPTLDLGGRPRFGFGCSAPAAASAAVFGLFFDPGGRPRFRFGAPAAGVTAAAAPAVTASASADAVSAGVAAGVSTVCAAAGFGLFFDSGGRPRFRFGASAAGVAAAGASAGASSTVAAAAGCFFPGPGGRPRFRFGGSLGADAPAAAAAAGAFLPEPGGLPGLRLGGSAAGGAAAAGSAAAGAAPAAAAAGLVFFPDPGGRPRFRFGGSAGPAASSASAVSATGCLRWGGPCFRFFDPDSAGSSESSGAAAADAPAAGCFGGRPRLRGGEPPASSASAAFAAGGADRLGGRPRHFSGVAATPPLSVACTCKISRPDVDSARQIWNITDPSAEWWHACERTAAVSRFQATEVGLEHVCISDRAFPSRHAPHLGLVLGAGRPAALPRRGRRRRCCPWLAVCWRCVSGSPLSAPTFTCNCGIRFSVQEQLTGCQGYRAYSDEGYVQHDAADDCVSTR